MNCVIKQSSCLCLGLVITVVFLTRLDLYPGERPLSNSTFGREEGLDIVAVTSIFWLLEAPPQLAWGHTWNRRALQLLWSQSHYLCTPEYRGLLKSMACHWVQKPWGFAFHWPWSLLNPVEGLALQQGLGRRNLVGTTESQMAWARKDIGRANW